MIGFDLYTFVAELKIGKQGMLPSQSPYELVEAAAMVVSAIGAK